MFVYVDDTNRIEQRVVLRSMFAARKRVFIDLLGWDIPALDDRYEVDHFDGTKARYLILADGDHNHLASARLLPTSGPGILDTLFPDLSDGPLPTGEQVWEITRFCLSPDMRAAERRHCRNKLVTALASYALANGIDTYTGVAELGWARQILDFGWDCALLGEPKSCGTTTIAALRIAISPETLPALRRTGIFEEPCETLTLSRAA